MVLIRGESLTTRRNQIKLKVIDYVVLTHEGVNARRTKNRIRNAAIGATVGWFALPLIIPGEAIGIAGATTFGISEAAEAAEAAVGSFIGGITGANFVRELSKGLIGQIVEIDYQDGQVSAADVMWRRKKDDGSVQVVHKQHLLRHLQKIRVTQT